MAQPTYDELLQTLRMLQEQNRLLTEQNHALREQNQTFQEQIHQLKQQLEQAQRRAKRQAAPFSKGPPKAKPKKPGRKRGEQHGKHGHRLAPPPDQIDEVHDVPLPETCPCCQGHVLPTGTTTQFQTEIPRKPIHRQFNIAVGQCQGCGKRLQGRHELQTSDATGAAGSQLGPDAQAAIAELNKEAGLSHGKIVNTLDRLFGINLSRGASSQTVLRVAERLEPAYQEIRQAVADSEMLVVDETGWRVGGLSSWLHAWVGEDVTCYQIDTSRSADALETLLGLGWDGGLIHDGFSSYDRFTEATHQQCLAHLLRRVHKLEEESCGGAVHFPRALLKLFGEAMELHDRYRAGEATAEMLEVGWQEYDLRLLKLCVPSRSPPSHERLSNHLFNHIGDWFSFLGWPELPRTSNAAERALRPAVVNRKVWGGNRTWPGARAQGILSSVLVTCKQQAIRAIDFISQSLRAFGNALLPRPILLGTR